MELGTARHEENLSTDGEATRDAEGLAELERKRNRLEADRQTAEERVPGRAHWTDRHRQALFAADSLFGAFCVYMVLLGGASWLIGEATIRTPLLLLGFLAVNIAISQIGLRWDPYKVEILRTATGAVVAPAVYLLVDGPLYPWWPGAVIMALGSTVLLGLLTQKPFWGRVISVYYIAVLGVAAWLGIPDPNWYDFAVQAGVLAVVGLMFAQIMALLGEALQQEQERSDELATARDALFSEMEVAQEIQTLLLPKSPYIPDNEVEGRMVPADEVGGDYYDIIETEDRGVFLAIGDVSGHGVTSGLTMMMARASLMGALEANPDGSLAELYSILNRSLCKNLLRMNVKLYMTFALLEYVGNGRFHAVGLHLPFLIYRKKQDRVEEVDLEGMWLGVVGDLHPDQLPRTTLELEAGDVLFLYTDGIVEHFSAEGDMFGFDRLSQILHRSASQGPRNVIQAVLDELTQHSTDQDDDVTMLAVNHTGQVESAAVRR